MQCEDNSKLRTPLSEVCQTTDIGCVPITDGKPSCAPQPDELPFAFDPKATTLWIFSCKGHEWINFTKFTMCQLDALNLDNITNICDILNIGVNYSGTGECKQGTITLAELAERILECLKLETKIITIGEGDGNKVKISIEGLPLDPVYVTGRNIWSEGGSGTEADPLKIATYDPICKWPAKTQAQVDAANEKHLGACLDGEMFRIPLPPKVCELPTKNQAQVDAAQSVELVACVDGEGSKIPYIKPDPPVCESDQITLEQARQKGSALTIVACDNGQVVRIPVSGSGFFDRDYICVPLTDGMPTGAPLVGTGPLRIDCNGNLYVWLCDQNKWMLVRDGIEGLSQLNPVNVPDICNNFRMKGWYSNNSDPCVQDVWFTLSQLAQILGECGLATKEYVNIQIDNTKKWVIENFTNDFTNIVSTFHACFGMRNVTQNSVLRVRDRKFLNLQGAPLSGPTVEHQTNRGTPWVARVNLRNTTDRNALGVINVNGLFFSATEGMDASMKLIISDERDISFVDPFPGGADDESTIDGYPTNYALITLPERTNRSSWNKDGTVIEERKGVGGSILYSSVIVPPNSTITRFIQAFFIFNSAHSNCGVDYRLVITHHLIY